MNGHFISELLNDRRAIALLPQHHINVLRVIAMQRASIRVVRRHSDVDDIAADRAGLWLEKREQPRRIRWLVRFCVGNLDEPDHVEKRGRRAVERRRIQLEWTVGGLRRNTPPVRMVCAFGDDAQPTTRTNSSDRMAGLLTHHPFLEGIDEVAIADRV